MEHWLVELERVLHMLMGHPGSALERWVIVGLVCVALVWVLGRAGSAFGMSNTSVFHGAVAGVAGVVIVLAAMTAARLYVPQGTGPQAALWIMVGAGVGASVLLVVPLMCLLQKSGYLASLLTWLVSAAAAAAVIVLVSAVFDGVASGGRSADRTRARRDLIENAVP